MIISTLNSQVIGLTAKEDKILKDAQRILESIQDCLQQGDFITTIGEDEYIEENQLHTAIYVLDEITSSNQLEISREVEERFKVINIVDDDSQECSV